MAKQPTITTVTSGYTSGTTINANFEALRDAFANTVSRDGSTPNTMTADFDLNNNDVLNAKNISCTSITINGSDLGDVVTVAGSSNFLLGSNNLSDVADAATARDNLGLGGIDLSGSNLQVGTDDTTQGSIYVYGGALTGEGGLIRLYNSAADDTLVSYYSVGMNGDGDFSIARQGTLEIILGDSNGVVEFPEGDVKVGVSHTEEGIMNFYGGATTTNPQINLYAAASNDTNNDFYRLTLDGEDLDIQDDGGNSLLKYDFGNSRFIGMPGRLLNVQIFTASGTYTPTQGTSKIIVEVVGAGGGGGGADTSGSAQAGVGGGGHSGGELEVLYTGVDASFSATVTIGSGGAAGVGSTATDGGAGGNSSFVRTAGSPASCSVTATGGLGGQTDTNVAVFQFSSEGSPNTNTAPTGGTVLRNRGSIASEPAWCLPSPSWSVNSSVALASNGASGSFGQGGYGARGSAGGTAASSAAGDAASGYGAGGGGARATSGASGGGTTAVNGGAGAGGLVRVWEFSD